MNNIKILIIQIVVTIVLSTTLNAVCTSDVYMGDKVITTSATTFADNALITKAYARDKLGDTDDTNNTVKDIDGNVYKTVQIGHQIWMAENMRVRNYTNDDGTIGDAIPHDGSTDGSDGWENNENCYSFLAKYGTDKEGDENDPEFKTYGLLYQWDAAMNGEESTDDSSNTARGICPIGWHIPTNGDWDTLQDILGDDSTQDNNWSNGGAENIGTAMIYGKFNNNCVMGGARREDKAGWDGKGRGARGIFWSSVEKDDSAWTRHLSVSYTGMERVTEKKGHGYSVRCIKD